MPIMDDSGMEQHALGGTGFGFSAKRIGDLGATEYTLVTVAADATGSVHGFQDKIENAIKAVVLACRKSPRADNLMLRLVTFNTSMGVHEVHGFKPLAECNTDAYTGCVQPGGATNLYDAAFSAAGSINQYGRDLTKQDFACNGIFIVITDGDDNASKTTPTMLKDEIAKGVSGESLESVVSILVGVNVTDASMSRRLAAFQTDAGFTQYVEVDNATDAKLAPDLPLVPSVNVPFWCVSEVVGELCEGHPFAFGWHISNTGRAVYSLRSRGDFDVSSLAKRWGGGGHKNSAGFNAPVPVHFSVDSSPT